MEKLQLLKTPEERQRRMEEIPRIHSDPNMDPSHESEEEEEPEEKKQGLSHFPSDYELTYFSSFVFCTSIS